MIWRTTGDRNRATKGTGRAGQALALALGVLGIVSYAESSSVFDVFTIVLAFFLYQAAGAAVVQGAVGQRIQNITVADIMDREPVTIPAEVTLLDAQEQWFTRYHWPWFAVVDPARHFLGVVRQQRVEAEIAAGRPALQVVDALEPDLPVRIGEEAPLESLLGVGGARQARRNGRRRRRRSPPGRRHARPGAAGAGTGDLRRSAPGGPRTPVLTAPL